MKKPKFICPYCGKDRDDPVPYKKACDLVGRFNINFTHNPGGGVFYFTGQAGKGDCQISAMCNYCDLDKLTKWLQDKNLLEKDQ